MTTVALLNEVSMKAHSNLKGCMLILEPSLLVLSLPVFHFKEIHASPLISISFFLRSACYMFIYIPAGHQLSVLSR